MVSTAFGVSDSFSAPARLATDLDHPKIHKCSACGQAVDRRQLGEVLHHEVPNHRPIPSATS